MLESTCSVLLFSVINYGTFLTVIDTEVTQPKVQLPCRGRYLESLDNSLTGRKPHSQEQ